MLARLERFFLPYTCVLCGANGQTGLDLCAACEHELPRYQAICRHCGSDAVQDTATHCQRCQNVPPYFDTVLTPFAYQHGVRYLVRQLKFRKHFACAKTLGLLLARSLSHNIEKPDCLMPVPLHRWRYSERGFNQSLEIAKHLSQALDIRLDANSCQRLRHTPHQVGLNAFERGENIQQAFRMTSRFQAQQTQPINVVKHVAIIDDVVTTGSTTNEMARMLKTSGCQRVQVWAFARASL